jgi:hypothetical protein
LRFRKVRVVRLLLSKNEKGTLEERDLQRWPEGMKTQEAGRLKRAADPGPE